MIIISQYEVQELLLDIRKSKNSILHIYAPRPNLGFRALNGLDLYTVPAPPGMQTLPWRLVVKLNLLAGQPYLGLIKK